MWRVKTSAQLWKMTDLALARQRKERAFHVRKQRDKGMGRAVQAKFRARKAMSNAFGLEESWLELVLICGSVWKYSHWTEDSLMVETDLSHSCITRS